MILILIKLLTVTVLIPFLVYALYNLQKGYINVLYVFYPVFYVFYILPLLADVIFGLPDYSIYNFKLFEISKRDGLTTSFYSFLTITGTIILFLCGVKNKIHLNEIFLFERPLKNRKFAIRILKVVFVTVALIPLLLTLHMFIQRSIDFSSLFDYRYLSAFYRSDSTNFLIFYYLTFLSVFSFIAYAFLSKRPVIVSVLIFIVPLFISFGINGKRTIFAYFLFLFCFMIYLKKEISPKVIIWVMTILAIVGISLSTIYQSTVRQFSGDLMSPEDYVGMRVDFGRDDVLSMSIYAALENEKIKTDDGVSLLYFSKVFGNELVDLGLVTPYKYSVYATSYLLDLSQVEDLGWGMTTGVWDELIANFGMLSGSIIFLLFYCTMMRFADSSRNKYFILLTYLFSILNLALQLTSFAMIVFIWVIFCASLLIKRVRL